jgi:hypothetical protein
VQKYNVFSKVPNVLLKKDSIVDFLSKMTLPIEIFLCIKAKAEATPLSLLLLYLLVSYAMCLSEEVE